MLVTVASVALNASIGIAVWQSQLQLTAKIIITAILLIKVALFFCSVWMSDGGAIARWEIAACMVLNIALLVYALHVKEIFVIMTAAGASVLLLIWTVGNVFQSQSR